MAAEVPTGEEQGEQWEGLLRAAGAREQLAVGVGWGPVLQKVARVSFPVPHRTLS